MVWTLQCLGNDFLFKLILAGCVEALEKFLKKHFKQHLCMKLNYFLISVPGANGGTGNGTGPGGKLVSGDLDASLANLTSNLNLGAGQAK